MSWPLEEATYHTKSGKFCPKDQAATVSKDGERFKVVRQHRRMKPKGKKAKAKKVSEGLLNKVAEVKARAARVAGIVERQGWIPMADVLGAE